MHQFNDKIDPQASLPTLAVNSLLSHTFGGRGILFLNLEKPSHDICIYFIVFVKHIKRKFQIGNDYEVCIL